MGCTITEVYQCSSASDPRDLLLIVGSSNSGYSISTGSDTPGSQTNTFHIIAHPRTCTENTDPAGAPQLGTQFFLLGFGCRTRPAAFGKPQGLRWNHAGHEFLHLTLTGPFFLRERERVTKPRATSRLLLLLPSLPDKANLEGHCSQCHLQPWH